MDIYRYPDFNGYAPWPTFPYYFGGQGDLIQQPNFMGVLDPLLELMMPPNNIMVQPSC